MQKINIKQTFKDDYITRQAGEKLRSMITEAVNNHGAIELDFSNIIIASTSFFDEGIAKLLLEGWSQKMLEDKVILKNINHNDLKLLKSVKKFRVEQCHKN